MLKASFRQQPESAEFAPLPDEQLKRVLVTVTIHEVLLETGSDNLIEEVNRKLQERHSCGIDDCYDNPTLLADVLRDIFGKSCMEVIYPIRVALAEFSYVKSISTFLKKLGTK